MTAFQGPPSPRTSCGRHPGGRRHRKGRKRKGGNFHPRKPPGALRVVGHGVVAALGVVSVPDSMPPLATESQQVVVVNDSCGVSTEPGRGAQRDMLAKAEKAALVADARANIAQATAALEAANATARAALAVQSDCARRLRELKQLLFDLTGGH